MRSVRAAGFVGALLVAGLLAAGFVVGGDRGAVDWRSVRAVVLESDDWGLAGFTPSAEAWAGIDREALAPGRFPPVYWGSTLEDSAQVAALAAVLASVTGRDGLPAVLQPNYVMGALWRDGDAWRETRLPDLPPAYRRPGLWQAVTAARAAGVWRPELHASWHYDPEQRRARALADSNARLATERGILLFPGSERAWELGPERPETVLDAELTAAEAGFAACFGRPVASVIAPDYTWDRRVEDLWSRHGLHVIQAKREQRNPGNPGGLAGRALKVLDRRWDQLVHPGRVYLERNCRFEPAQSPDAAAVTARCAAEVRRAWRHGEPAIIETHRVNFVHVDPAVPRQGRAALARLLADVAADGPVFLTDTEVAQLARRGVSARRVPEQGIILRNASHSRRVVAVGGRGSRPLRLVALPAGAEAVLQDRDGGSRLVPLP